jgi:hypothetical protein
MGVTGYLSNESHLSMDRVLWLALAAGAGIVASKITQKTLAAGWERARHEDPPADPTRAPLARAALWATLLGAGAGLAKTLMLRGTARVWESTTGQEPPV